MSREIKFRGKRIDNGEWVYGYYYKEAVHDDDANKFIHIEYIKEIYGDHYVNREIEKGTSGEFTGLKEIFEGDIMKGLYKGKEFIGKVVYVEWLSGFKVLSNLGRLDIFENDEIIGNIHQDKHLLK